MRIVRKPRKGKNEHRQMRKKRTKEEYEDQTIIIDINNKKDFPALG